MPCFSNCFLHFGIWLLLFLISACPGDGDGIFLSKIYSRSLQVRLWCVFVPGSELEIFRAAPRADPTIWDLS